MKFPDGRKMRGWHQYRGWVRGQRNIRISYRTRHVMLEEKVTLNRDDHWNGKPILCEKMKRN